MTDKCVCYILCNRWFKTRENKKGTSFDCFDDEAKRILISTFLFSNVSSFVPPLISGVISRCGRHALQDQLENCCQSQRRPTPSTVETSMNSAALCDNRNLKTNQIVLKMAPRRFLDNEEFSSVTATVPVYTGGEERRKSLTSKRSIEKFKLQVSSVQFTV